MSTTTDSSAHVSNLINQQKRQALVTVRQIAQRDARGKAGRGDTKRLKQCFADGVPSQTYPKLVALYKQLFDLQASRDQFSHVESACDKARKTLEHHDEQSCQIAGQRARDRKALQHHADEARHKLEAIQQDMLKLQRIQIQHAALLGLSMQNLDAFNLTTDRGTRRMPASLCDAEAEWIEVPADVFDTEYQRRLQHWRHFLSVQMPRRIEQYQQDLAHWQAQYLDYQEVPVVARQVKPRSYSRKRVNETGRYAPKPGAPACPQDPRRSTPTWREVRAHLNDAS